MVWNQIRKISEVCLYSFHGCQISNNNFMLWRKTLPDYHSPAGWNSGPPPRRPALEASRSGLRFCHFSHLRGGGGGAAVRTRLGSKLVLRVRLVNSQTMHRVSHPGDEPRHCLSREEKNSATPQTPPRRSGSHEGPGLECGCELVSGIWSHVPRPLGVQNGEVSQRGRTGSNVREAGGP